METELRLYVIPGADIDTCEEEVVEQTSPNTLCAKAIQSLVRVEEDTKKTLNKFMDSDLRNLADTRRRCSRLWEDVYNIVARVSRYCYPGTTPNPRRVFDEAFYNYQFYYNNEALTIMFKRAEEGNNQPLLHHNPHFPLTLDLKKIEKPNLALYQKTLPHQLRSILPLYIATYFVARPSLLFPKELQIKTEKQN